ncbi:hypothetical protein L6R52_03790 [Myxococcota bacterium]|nr:hypothetical protein [Myxococcota bacterium]
MRALIFKELVQLRAYFAAIVALHALGALVTLLEDAAVVEPTRVLQSAVGAAWVFLVLVFAAAVKGVPEDFREGQIHFLDALPIGRARIFVAKAAALAVLVVVSVVVTSIGVAFDLAVLGPEVGETAASIATVAIIALVLGLAGAGLGFLVSWTGSLSWLFVVLGVNALEAASLFDVGAWEVSLSALDPLFFEPTSLAVPERFVRFWAFTGLVGLVGGGLVFRAPGDLFARLERRGSERLGRILGLVLAGLVLLAGGLSFVFGTARFSKLLRGPAEVTERAGLLFSYPVSGRADAERVMADAERLDAHVRTLFPGVERPRLVVELKPPGKTHAGDFSEGKLRIAPGEDAQRIFIHELTHAYQWVLAGSSPLERWRFFAEGLASWVEQDAGFHGEELERSERMAGLIYRAGRHHFGLLVEDREHRERFDDAEVYPLGLVFTAAVVDVGGRTAPMCLLRAIGERGRAAGSAIAMWLDVSGVCGLELDRVVARYEARLAELAARAGELPPSVDGRVVRAGDQLVLDVWEGPRPPARCRFRRSKDTTRQQTEVTGVRDGYCVVPATQRAERKLEYQLGWVLDGVTLFGPWSTRPVPVEDERCADLACLAGQGRIARWGVASDARSTARAVRWGHEESITAATFSEDGRIVVTGSGRGATRVWDARTGAMLGLWPDARGARGIELSRDGAVVSASEGVYLTLRRVSDGALLGRHVASQARARLDAEYSVFVVSSRDGVSVFDAATHRRVAALAAGPELGQIVDGRVDLPAIEAALDAVVPPPRGTWLSGEGAPSDLGALGLSEDEQLLTRGRDGRYFVADERSGEGRIIDASGATLVRLPAVESLSTLTAVGEREVALVVDRSLVMLDATRCETIRELPWPFFGAVAISRDGRRAFVGHRGRDLVEVDMTTGRVVARAPVDVERVRALDLSGDERHLLVTSDDAVWVVDAEARVVRDRFELKDGRVLVRGSRLVVRHDDTLAIAELATDGRVVVRTSTVIDALGVDAEGSMIAASVNGDVRFFDAETLATRGALEPDSAFHSAVALAGDRLFAFDLDGVSHEARVAPGAALRKLPRVHVASPRSSVWLPAEGLFVTAGRDGLLASWDVARGELRCAILYERTGSAQRLDQLPW